MTIAHISPEHLKSLLDKHQAILIDVRNPAEYREEKIDCAINIPLESVNSEVLQPFSDKKIVFQCQAGRRSQEACARLHSISANIASLEDGIEGWKKAGFPTQNQTGSSAIPLMRQVQLTIGIMVLTGTILGIFVHSWFLALPLIMGAGLANAGLTGWCGLARFIELMPWNRT